MAVLCVVNTGPMLIAVSITEMVILYKYVQPNPQPQLGLRPRCLYISAHIRRVLEE